MAVEEAYKRRIPMYGPLHIKHPDRFLKKAKKDFKSTFDAPFPYKVSRKDVKFLFVLGTGSFGTVILAIYKPDHTFFAVKSLDKSELLERKANNISEVLTEKRILQSLNSPFCVRLEYFYQDQRYIYLFMPFASGGDIFTLLRSYRKLDEILARFYVSQVVLAFEYLHYIKLIYRDLKPENLLIDHLGYLKLTDFGFAKVVHSRTYTFCGTPDYISPEMIRGHGYGTSVDWWALGVLLFELVAGQAPFNARGSLNRFKKILLAKYSIPQFFSKELKDIIKKLLIVDTTMRYGNLKGGLEDIKGHVWFTSIDWYKLLNREVVPPFVPPDAGQISKAAFPNLRKYTKLESAKSKTTNPQTFGDF